MKKVNWKEISINNLSTDCFWNQQQQLPGMNAVFDGLKEKFALPKKKVERKTGGKPIVPLRVLEANRAQNLLILLRVVLKSVPLDQIKKYILQCDTSILNVQFNEGLIKCLPQPHAMKLLQQAKKDNVELSEVENFVASLSDIERLAPRLECINFQICYDDMKSNLEHEIKVGIDACKEVVVSQKFKKMLSIILSIGNFLNLGGKTDGNRAKGFELNILSKLNEIRTTDNKSTLLKHIVEIIGTKYAELWDFGIELVQVKEAARLNTTKIKETIQNLSVSSDVLKKEVGNRSIHRLSDDKFIEVMSPFSLECCRQIDELTLLVKQMELSYEDVGNVYGFDVKSCPMQEVFSSIQTFEINFTKTYTDMFKIPKLINRNEEVQQNIQQRRIDSAKYTCVKVKVKRLTEEGSLLLII